jgi:diphthine-ammonia ligase
VEQGTEYGGRNPSSSGGVLGDETEDLYELLATVKVILCASSEEISLKPKQAHHPNVKGVSVGAILSNYQRVRVEHV